MAHIQKWNSPNNTPLRTPTGAPNSHQLFSQIHLCQKNNCHQQHRGWRRLVACNWQQSVKNSCGGRRRARLKGENRPLLSGAPSQNIIAKRAFHCGVGEVSIFHTRRRTGDRQQNGQHQLSHAVRSQHPALLQAGRKGGWQTGGARWRNQRDEISNWSPRGGVWSEWMAINLGGARLNLAILLICPPDHRCPPSCWTRSTCTWWTVTQTHWTSYWGSCATAATSELSGTSATFVFFSSRRVISLPIFAPPRIPQAAKTNCTLTWVKTDKEISFAAIGF